MFRIGILHPGEMGVSIAASAIDSGHQVYWVSQGRGERTRARAEEHNLVEVASLLQLCQTCKVILSVCPPHAAEDVARSVAATQFDGSYVDANAISPQRSVRIGQLMQSAGIRFIDGGIIGGPAWKPKETWLYLSGEHSQQITACFSKGPLQTRIIGDEIGKASALKMCYAAYSKGTTALLAAIVAASETLGIREELYQQWDMDDQDFSEQVNQRVKRVTAKAWRFEGEMKEIAETFREAGLPGEFHEAAAQIYHRMSGLKNSTVTPSLHDILAKLITQ